LRDEHPVSPLKKTACLRDRMTSEDHKVALRIARRIRMSAGSELMCDFSGIAMAVPVRI
jgi:hypothetical protein